jgi:hypothetical protein
MVDQVDLDSLVGEHVLDAVDTFSESIKQYGNHFEDCSIIRFRIDGTVYTAIEDPDDGYRSSLGQLFVSTDEPMKNVFPSVRVLGRKKENERSAIHDTLQFVDVVSGEVVLEVGTDNTDDYYPWFVSSFWPDRMAVNQSGVSARERMQGEG